MNRNKNSVKDCNNGKGTGKRKGGGKPSNTQYNNKRTPKRQPQKGGYDVAHDGEIGKQDAGLYFGDVQLAEDNSYVSSRNILDIRRKMPGTDFFYPTVFVHGLNPSPGVSYVDTIKEIVYPSGLKLAANQIKTAIIANNGRISNYTSVDIIILLLMIGEYVALTEFIRRVFGAKYKFADLNRDIPKSFVEAMGFDYDDFIDNLNKYQSMANKLINYGAPIVIPMDKIPYLRKCRDLYQEIYQDQAAGQMCYHINVPRTTWHLKEDEEFGTRLETVGVTQILDKFWVYAPQSNTTPSSLRQSQKFVQRISHRTFGDFLKNVYEPLVMSLTTSNTFNDIYSDLRSVKFQSSYSFEFWKPELIRMDYECPVVESEDWLNIYHNARYTGDVTYAMDYHFANDPIIPALPKLNDVVTDPTTDDLRYNPLFVRNKEADGVISVSKHSEVIPEPPYILDFKDVNPPLDSRVDAMIYTSWPRGHHPEKVDESNGFEFQCNWLLPDHYFTNTWAYVGDVADELPEDLHFWPVSNRNQIGHPFQTSYANGKFQFDLYYETVENNGFVLHSDPIEIVTQNSQLFNDRGNYINYLEGAPIALDTEVVALSSPATPAAPKFRERYKYPIGNLDQWYVLDLIKFENMFDHVYQYVFTADGIVK